MEMILNSILFSPLCYIDKYKIIVKSLNHTEQANIDIEIQNSIRQDVIAESYIPKFSTNTSNSFSCFKTMKLYNAKGQGNYGMCWAASVATIVNYLKGSNITAKQVCNKMGIGYNEGGTINDKQKALKKYSINYNHINQSTISWSKVKSNVNNKKPIAISASANSGKNWHAVTIIGYQNYKVNDYIVIWNSGLNGGNGGSQVIYYYNKYTTFQYGGSLYTWVKTLSYY